VHKVIKIKINEWNNWKFSRGAPPALQLFCGFAPMWYRFLSVKSHNNGQQLGLGVLFHLNWPHLAIYGVFLPFFNFKFHTASARRPPKIKFLILWAAANGVHRKFTRDIWYFFWYFLSSSEYRAKKQARRKALAAGLPLAHFYG